MILIIGSHQDDVLYCSSLLTKRTTDMYLGRFPMQKGAIFNQETILLSGIHTSLLASSVVSSFLTQYYVNLIFVVGKCFSIDTSFKRGDILVSKDIVNIDVDQIDVANATLNQIPGLPTLYRVQKDVIGYIRDGFSKRTLVTPNVASFLSSDNLFSRPWRKSWRRRRCLVKTGLLCWIASPMASA